MKNHCRFCLFLLSFSSSCLLQLGNCQPTQPIADANQQSMASSFRPSIAVVIGILSIMFSLTFLLLMYAKFCHAAATDMFNGGNGDNPNGIGGSRFSGIDKTVIESLPFFRFSSLKGSKEGLECSVCLSRFEDTEVLRLLPKCKHAFHIECVDRWLESHSSCPLCRYKVNPHDLTIFSYSNSLRFPGRDPSDMRQAPEDSTLELFVERELEDDDQFGPSVAATATASSSSSARFSLGASFRKGNMSKKDDPLIPQGKEEEQQTEQQQGQPYLHKFKHRIIVSDVMSQNRWSDVNSSDLMFLNSEMLGAASSRKFWSPLDSSSERFTAKPVAAGVGPSANEGSSIMKIKEEMERKRALEIKAGSINRSFSVSGQPSTSKSGDSYTNIAHVGSLSSSAGKRSMSEITNFSRFGGDSRGNSARKREASSAAAGESNAKEERQRRLWLPIARRTIQWFTGRERRAQSHQPTNRQELNV